MSFKTIFHSNHGNFSSNRLPSSKFFAFTLIELLVAIAVLTMMMGFVFTLLQRTISIWELGNKRLEASIAARVGLNIVAQELEFAITGDKVIDTFVPNNQATNQTNIFPLSAFRSATRLPGVGSREVAVPGSDQTFFIHMSGNAYNDFKVNSTIAPPFEESGFMCLFVVNPIGAHNKKDGYYLVKHRKGPIDFFFRGNANSVTTNWFSANSDSADTRIPVIDNCLRFRLTPMQTNSSGVLSPMNNWSSFNTLPPQVVGFIAEVITIDSKTATKLFQIRQRNILDERDIDSITNSMQPNNSIQRLLREGSVVMRRYIPLRNKN